MGAAQRKASDLSQEKDRDGVGGDGLRTLSVNKCLRGEEPVRESGWYHGE